MTVGGAIDRRKAVPGALWFDPGADLRRVAAVICERAWRGLGVRVYRWPDGMVVLVSTDSRGDELLMRHAFDALVGTYCRAGALGEGVVGAGPQLFDVLDQLRWVATCAPPPQGDGAEARSAFATSCGRPLLNQKLTIRSGSFPAGPDAGCTAAISR